MDDLRFAGKNRAAFSRARRHQSRLCLHRGIQHRRREKRQCRVSDFGLYWPREVYGRLAAELSRQGAKAAAFDILFGELRSDHPPVQMADGSLVENDDYFALQLRRAGNVILADTGDAALPALFATNALALGDVTAEKDADGCCAASGPSAITADGIRFSKKRRTSLAWIWPGANSRPAKSFCRKPARPTPFPFPLTPENNFLCRPCRKKSPARLAAHSKSVHRSARLADGHRSRRAGIEARFAKRRSGFAARQNRFARRERHRADDSR